MVRGVVMIGDSANGLSKNIGFISVRFAGTDGVSLETAKWANIFENEIPNAFTLKVRL